MATALMMVTAALFRLFLGQGHIVVLLIASSVLSAVLVSVVVCIWEFRKLIFVGFAVMIHHRFQEVVLFILAILLIRFVFVVLIMFY
jgi:hypothetical protein